MSFISKFLGLEKWPQNNEYSFVIQDNVYANLVMHTMNKHPCEFFFYIISKVEKSAIGNILIAKHVVFLPEIGGSRIATDLPPLENIRKQVGALKQDEVVILCHTHYSKSDIRLQAEHSIGRFSLKMDMDKYYEFVKHAKVPLKKVFFGIFIMPLKNEERAYYTNYLRLGKKILIVKSSDKREYSVLDVGMSKSGLIKTRSKNLE
ncbi:hypothetical protein HQ585_13095 [candidate division KSB1 bacterium]|nr:hypothetical protein [candidate division KSB1 bacterium]